MTPRIALIHAVDVAIPPTHAAFATLWPEAALMNLFDDTLSPDRAAEGALTPRMSARIMALARYAAEAGAAGILFTCSAFGPAIEAAARALHPLPVLKPNEAMFAAAASAGGTIGMLATFGPACAGMEAEFAATCGLPLHTVLVSEAMTALRNGDGAKHDHLLATAAEGLSGRATVMLAHFSTSRAATAVRAALPAAQVLTAPDAAVLALRMRIAPQQV